MKFLNFLIISSLILVPTFGLLILTHSGNHMMEGKCAASLIDNVACPKDSLFLAFHHFSVYQILSNSSTFEGLSLLWLATLFLLLFIFIQGYLYFLGKGKFSWRKSLIGRSFFSSSLSPQFRYWLSLLENSPSFGLSA